MRSLFKTLAAIAALHFLAGCGGSSSSSPPSPAATGGFTLLVGDAPEDDFDAIVLTIDNVVLLSESGQQDLQLEEPVSVDLLQLSNLTELLVDTELPVGSYSKIRLFVSNLELQVEDANGELMTVEQPRLLANGKVDLNPQGAFEIRAGQDLIVEVDVDLNNSIQLTATGSGEYRFRPVVFVDVLEQDDDARLVRLFGELRNIDGTAGAFDLCEPGEDEDCVRVTPAANALLIDNVGNEQTVDTLIETNLATVFGRFTMADDDGFDAYALVVGAENDLEQLEGTVVAAPQDGLFDLATDDGTRMIELLSATLILDDDGVATNSEALVTDAELEAWTVQPPGEDQYLAIVIQLEGDDAAFDDDVEGALVSFADGVLNLVADDASDICVRVDAETSFVQISADTDSAASEEFDLTEFVARYDAEEYAGAEWEVEVSGELAEGCYNAEMLILELED